MRTRSPSRVVVGGRVYTALTPEQKKLKKKYLQEEGLLLQRKNDRIPTFEEAWQYVHDHSDVISGKVEDYAHDYSRVEADLDDVMTWLASQGLLPPEPDPSADQDQHYEWEEKVDRLVGRYQDDVSDLMSEEKALEYAREELEDAYYESVSGIERGFLDRNSCWRAVELPLSVNPVEHPSLGPYWATDPEGADVYGNVSARGTTQTVVYRARVDLENVDKEGTILANMTDTTDSEHEVRFYEGAPVYVYDVTLEDGTVLEINDWRTT